MTSLTPQEIVSELDRHIIGQKDAKKAVALALRNRWRRSQVEAPLRDEIVPKNILMIGPTGVGKTEIARRLAKLAHAPFIKVEATKFTEVGYVGRDVDSIVRDLVDFAINLLRDQKRSQVRAQAEADAEETILDALIGQDASAATRQSFRAKLRSGEIDDREIEIEVSQAPSSGPMMDIPGMPGGQIGIMNLSDMFGSAFGKPKKQIKTRVVDALDILLNDAADALIDQDQLTQDALALVENHGIVFIDEIDKIAARSEHKGGDVSREGVQRDLLPLIEGTTVSTKHGFVKTDHILFIASGAFHVSKPSDLLPELQGRLPIRVELCSLTKEDFKAILNDTEASLTKQYCALLKTEGVEIVFTPEGIDALADIAVDVNARIENIGARRLQTVMEKLLEDVSFHAPNKGGERIIITREYVITVLAELAGNTDLSRFIL